MRALPGLLLIVLVLPCCADLAESSKRDVDDGHYSEDLPMFALAALGCIPDRCILLLSAPPIVLQAHSSGWERHRWRWIAGADLHLGRSFLSQVRCAAEQRDDHGRGPGEQCILLETAASRRAQCGPPLG